MLIYLVFTYSDNDLLKEKDDLEEFGTGGSSISRLAVKSEVVSRKKATFKSTKMHLYADELAGSRGGKREKERSDEDDDNDDESRFKAKRSRLIFRFFVFHSKRSDL
jgi:hypothetical protein